jgi:flagellar basal-body rod protein FlgB
MNQLSPHGVNKPVPKLQVSSMYSIPYQNSKDGNTVELGVEKGVVAYIS